MADLLSGQLSPNNADFLPQFKAIGQGLKKRFFRKPNVAEAIEQYEELALELQRENQSEFAAVCYVEAAKCHEPLKNPVQQANLLLKSGRLYLRARDGQRYFQDDFDSLFFRSQSLHSSLAGQTPMGVQCLSQAAQIYKREKLFGLSVLVSMEVAEALFREGSYGEALKYYKTSLDTVRAHFTYIDQVAVSEQIIRCKLAMTDYESALKMITDTLLGVGNSSADEISHDLRAKLTNRLEIMRVCLLILLGTNSVDMLGFIWPDAKGKPDNFDQTPTGLRSILPSTTSASFKASSSEEDEEGGRETAEEQVSRVQVQLKSLVLAVQHGSVDEIEDVRGHLASVMFQSHHDLFDMLIKMLS